MKLKENSNTGLKNSISSKDQLIKELLEKKFSRKNHNNYPCIQGCYCDPGKCHCVS